MPTNEIEIVSDQNTLCGEGPLWDATNGRMHWVDIERSLIFEYRLADQQTSVLSRDLCAHALAMNFDGRLVVGGVKGICLRSENESVTPVLENNESGDYSFNDMIAGPSGHLYAGAMHWVENDMERLGRLYLIDGKGLARVVDEGIELSNGLGFSPDNRTLYYADSSARKIRAYDVDPATGDLSNKRVFVDLPAKDGLPDGMTVDAEGFVWCATWYGGQVLRFDPDGTLERRIPMPVKQVSSVAFGGPDLTDLYITSASEYWPSEFIPPGFDDQAAMGGALYCVRLDIQGKAEFPCKFD